MDLLIPSLLLIVGLAGLSYGADFLIRGAVSASRLIGISPFIIGLTVVAWGTSAPEVVVTVGAALGGVPDVAVGNVIGSNITNVLLIGGLTALVLPLCCAPATVRRDGAILVVRHTFCAGSGLYWRLLATLGRWLAAAGHGRPHHCDLSLRQRRSGRRRARRCVGLGIGQHVTVRRLSGPGCRRDRRLSTALLNWPKRSAFPKRSLARRWSPSEPACPSSLLRLRRPAKVIETL